MQADVKKVERLLKTARGQMDGVLKMIEEDRYCVDISNQLLATQAILSKVNKEIIKAHLHCCVKEAVKTDNSEEKIDEIIMLLEKMSK